MQQRKSWLAFGILLGLTLAAVSAAQAGSLVNPATLVRLQNGSETAPSLTFVTDPDTGLYLVQAGVIGLTADSIPILRCDNQVQDNPLCRFRHYTSVAPGNSPRIFFQRGRGSSTNSAPVGIGDVLGMIKWHGTASTNPEDFREAGILLMRSTATFSSTGHGGELMVLTAPTAVPPPGDRPDERLVVRERCVGIGDFDVLTCDATGRNVLSIGIGKAPLTSPADLVQGWVEDIITTSPTTAGFKLRDEPGNIYTFGRQPELELGPLQGTISVSGTATVFRVGSAGLPTKVMSSLATPGGLADGDWWVECSGTSPRNCSIKVRDLGVTRTIATSVNF